jgi:hypothetical protein
VIIDGVWISNRIYRTHDYTLQITVTHRLVLSVTVSPSRCLVAAANGGFPSSSGFPNFPRPQLPASQLTACLQTLSQLTGSWYSLYSLGTDRTENTASDFCSVVAWVSVAAFTWRLLSHCLATTVYAGFMQTCHNMYTCKRKTRRGRDNWFAWPLSHYLGFCSFER